MAEIIQPGNCEIEVPAGLALGTFANAVRIVPDTGSDHLVDFLVYSSSEKRAVVVVRVRVHESLLVPIRDRFNVVIHGPEASRPALNVVPFTPSKKTDDPDPDPAI